MLPLAALALYTLSKQECKIVFFSPFFSDEHAGVHDSPLSPPIDDTFFFFFFFCIAIAVLLPSFWHDFPDGNDPCPLAGLGEILFPSSPNPWLS